MKKLIAFLFVIFIINKSKSQDFSYRSDKIFYEFIDTFPQKTKEDLFNKAKLFVLKFFNGSKNIIQNEDKDQGKITCKPSFEIEEYSGPDKGNHNCFFVLDITIKDEKIRLQIYNLVYDKYDMEMVKKVRVENKWKKSAEEFGKVVKQINTRINYLHRSMIESLKEVDSF